MEHEKTDPSIEQDSDANELPELMQSREEEVFARLEAAEAAQAEQQSAPVEAPSAFDDFEEPPAQDVVPTANTIDPRKLRFLRVLLAVNLAVMVVMLALPHPLENPRPSATGTAPAPAGTTPVGPGDDPLPPVFDAQSIDTQAIIADPTSQAMFRAAELHRAGDTSAAADILIDVLAEPGINPVIRRLMYSQVATYCRLAGRIKESIEYENSTRRLQRRDLLPADLREAAELAERDGDAVLMRQCLARLILQRDLSPKMKAMIREAYLGIGESYEMQARGK